MKPLDQYLALQKQIYDYFSYIEGWVIIPIDDRRDCFWKLNETEGYVGFAWTKEELVWGNDNYYQDDIYTWRFLPKWVYRGKNYTMICVDTQTDGNKFLAIYSNQLEVTK